MTDELLKEAIYAVALRDTLNKYPSGCFAQLYYNYIKNLDPHCDKTYIFYRLCTEAARLKGEKWPRIIGTTYPDLKETYCSIVTSMPFPFGYNDSTDEELIKYLRKSSVSHCINGKYYCAVQELDYTDEEFSNILRKMLEYSQIDFKKELEQIKFDRIKEDF